MDHTPFIWSAYGLSALVLAWAALSPVLRRRHALANLERLGHTERSHDTHA